MISIGSCERERVVPCPTLGRSIPPNPRPIAPFFCKNLSNGPLFAFPLVSRPLFPGLDLVQFLAVTTADRLKEIPFDFWWKMLLALVAFVALIVFLRKVAKMNKVVLTVIVGFVVVTIGFNWIFERNEPAWATPMVSWMSGFLPTKVNYVNNQQPAPASTAPSVAAKKKT